MRNMETMGSADSPQEPDTSVANLESMYNHQEPVNSDSVANLEEMFAQPSVSDEARQANLRNNETPVDATTAAAEHTIETTNKSPDFYSRTADRLTSGTAKVAAILEKLSAGAPARQEARADKMETAKETIRKVGRGALKGAKNAGLMTLGMSVLTVELTVDSGIAARDKVMDIAAKAREHFAMRADRRAAYQEQARRLAEERYNNDHEEALGINEQKKADQEAAYASYESNIDTALYNDDWSEAIDEDAKFNKLRTLRERKEAALARRAARKARVLEKYGNVRDKGGDLYKRAKGGIKRFGKAALRTFKRTISAGRAAASAAVSAGAKAWSESATSAPSN